MGNVIHVTNKNTRVMVFDDEFVHAMEDAVVYAGGTSTVVATDDTMIFAMDRATVIAFGRAIVAASGNSHVIAHDQVVVMMREGARATVYGDRVKVIADSEANVTRHPCRALEQDPPQSSQEQAAEAPSTPA